MGEYNPPEINASLARMVQAYSQALPTYMGATNAQILPNEQAQLAASRAVSPGYSGLQADLFRQYGPMLSQIGSDIQRQQQLSQLGTDTLTQQAANAPGGLNAATLQGLNQLDPQAAQNRVALSKGIGDLLGSINVNGLSGSEAQQVNRSLAQTNAARGITAPTSTSTVANAMTFGNALQGKREALAKALGTATQAAPALSTGLNPTSLYQGRTSTANTGVPQFMGVTPAGTTAQEMGQGLMGQTGSLLGLQQQIKANKPDTWQRVGQGFNMFGQLMKGVAGI